MMGCPLCRKEVKRYQAFVVTENEAIDWIDISKNSEALVLECINYDDAMQLIHVKNGDGVHQVGLEGVLTLWDKVPYYRVISRLIRKFPVSHSVLARLYEWLAKNRMVFVRRRK